MSTVVKVGVPVALNGTVTAIEDDRKGAPPMLVERYTRIVAAVDVPDWTDNGTAIETSAAYVEDMVNCVPVTELPNTVLMPTTP